MICGEVEVRGRRRKLSASAGGESCAETVVPLDYSRTGLGVSSIRLKRVFSKRRWAAVFVCGVMFASVALAQYPGRVTKTDNSKPILRSVAVLEWTGTSGKPSASRLVPVAVYDGEQLNDGTIYLTRPEPLALANGVEYELQSAGKATGLFDVFGAGELNGTWQGFGVWKPLTAPEAAKAKAAFNTSALYGGGDDAADNDHPVLKRKHPKGTDSDDGSGSGSSTTGAASRSGGDASAKPAPAAGNGSESDDPDRPTLKRKRSNDSGSGSGTDSASAGTGTVDPDRPTLHRNRHIAAEGEMETSTAAPDPDRPRLKRGKPVDAGSVEIPKLQGLPPTMQQAVAVSDGSSRAEHPWKYSWPDLETESKTKAAMEAIARTALGLDAPVAPAPKKTAKKSTVAKRTPRVAPEPPPPAELADETFRAFELSFGASATMVLTASTPLPPVPEAKDDDEPPPPVIRRGKPAASDNAPLKQTPIPPTPAPQKFVTLVAQPDLYGGVMVLFKSVTDSAHLDDTPRMRLVDAVDAMADNRGELLFELRGKTQRQFALFRVLRGSAEQMFATVALP